MLCSPSLMTDAWRSDRINASNEKGVCTGSAHRLGSKLQRQVQARQPNDLIPRTLSKPLSFSRRLRRRREKLVLQPARPPFLLASDGLVGLGCEGNLWFSARLCRLGPSRCRVWCPGGACKVEAARPQWNKVLQALFHLVVTCSGVGDKPVGWELFRSGDRVGASDLDGSCTGVPTGARTC